MSLEIAPDQNIASTRRKLNNQLEPIKVMLIHKRNGMIPKSWENFVVQTRESILTQPDQYLDKDLPAQDVLRKIVTDLFEEFLAREKDSQ